MEYIIFVHRHSARFFAFFPQLPLNLFSRLVKKMMGILDLRGVLIALLLASSVAAHGGHESVPEGSAVSKDPIVSVVSFALCYYSALRRKSKRTNIALRCRTRHYGFI